MCLCEHSHLVYTLITQFLGLNVACACFITTSTALVLAEPRQRKQVYDTCKPSSVTKAVIREKKQMW